MTDPAVCDWQGTLIVTYPDGGTQQEQFTLKAHSFSQASAWCENKTRLLMRKRKPRAQSVSVWAQGLNPALSMNSILSFYEER